MKAYKIVRVGKNGKYYSCHFYVAHAKKAVEYKIGVDVFRKRGCGPLGAFKSLEKIKELKDRCFISFDKYERNKIFSNYFVWYQAKPPKIQDFKIFLCEITESKDSKGYFYLNNDGIMGFIIPEGTVLCESIKLLKEVEI